MTVEHLRSTDRLIASRPPARFTRSGPNTSTNSASPERIGHSVDGPERWRLPPSPVWPARPMLSSFLRGRTTPLIDARGCHHEGNNFPVCSRNTQKRVSVRRADVNTSWSSPWCFSRCRYCLRAFRACVPCGSCGCSGSRQPSAVPRRRRSGDDHRYRFYRAADERRIPAILAARQTWTGSYNVGVELKFGNRCGTRRPVHPAVSVWVLETRTEECWREVGYWVDHEASWATSVWRLGNWVFRARKPDVHTPPVPWGGLGGPDTGIDPSGDREPRRPIFPNRSGAAELDLPDA